MLTIIVTALVGLAAIAFPLAGGEYVTRLEAGKHASLPLIPEAQATEAAEAPLALYEVWLTAYSSTPEETDSTPHLTAQNTPVREGIVAANFLPFGTRIKIPSVFGDREFVVEDRMHRRKTNFVDVWMPTKEEAKAFGIRQADILVVAWGSKEIASAR